MIYPPLKVRAALQPWRRMVDLLLFQEAPDGSVNVVTRFEIAHCDLGVIPPDAPISLPLAQAQALMDDLWQCGLRPSEGTGSAGSLAATQKHLEDMRALTFNHLRVPKP
ncbi:MAG TPA: hypothetical protein VN436_14325 [Holophaga sp.]|nr:hypothetical protein [Holophaga sp.]